MANATPDTMRAEREQVVLGAHRRWREAGYSTLPVQLVKYTDSRGKEKKKPRFPGGSWDSAARCDIEKAIENGFLDVALVLTNVVQLDFDPREADAEEEADIWERLNRAVNNYNLDGCYQSKTGRGYQAILRAPTGTWTRNTAPPALIDEVRCGTDTSGHGLLAFVWPSWHPVANRYYEPFGPIVPVAELPECPVELLKPASNSESHSEFEWNPPGANGRSHGDWRTLDIVALFQSRGLYLRELGDGKHGVTCPWESAHTTGGDGTDTAVFEAFHTETGFPGFKCQHNHCEHRTLRDVREFFGADTIDRFCGQPFNANGNVKHVSPDEAPASDEPETLEWRTLADIDDSPPGDLLFGMLEPEAPNLIYGPGGVGKGMTSAWLIRECVNAGIRPLIYDAERHPREWRRRVSGLGVDPGSVVYVQPTDLPAALRGKPLHDVVPHLGRLTRAADCGILFVDSILAAANLSEEKLKSDAGAPYRYTDALGELGLTSVSIGHTPKLATTGEPYGSVSWVNAMRLTWLGTRAEGDGHRIRWTVRKRNERGRIAAMLLTFDYDDGGRLNDVRKEDADRETQAWVTDALVHGPRTVEDLAEEMIELDDTGSYGDAVARAKDRIRMTLNRMRRAGLAHKTGGRGSAWALGARRERRSQRETNADE